MKLTDENLDYMDCRPLRTDTGGELPERIRKLIEARQAEMRQEGRPAPKTDVPVE